METRAFDLGRLFLGTSPWDSALEFLLRAAVMFVVALLLVPTLWRRSPANHAPLGRVALIAAGVMLGYTILAREVPLLYAVIVLAALVGLYRFAMLAGLVTVWQSPGTREPRRVAHNGRLDPDAMRAARLTRDALFSALRQAGVAHLGQVSAAYLEPDGQISVLRCPEAEVRPGLPVTPTIGTARGVRTHQAINDGAYACSVCGQVLEFAVGAQFMGCPSCTGHKWVPAHPGAAYHHSAFDEKPAATPEKVQ